MRKLGVSRSSPSGLFRFSRSDNGLGGEPPSIHTIHTFVFGSTTPKKSGGCSTPAVPRSLVRRTMTTPCEVDVFSRLPRLELRRGDENDPTGGRVTAPRRPALHLASPQPRNGSRADVRLVGVPPGSRGGRDDSLGATPQLAPRTPPSTPPSKIPVPPLDDFHSHD